jgi:tetratricopeptide (TPR) repeat protein
MTEPVAFKYRAFISYSHADTSAAKWLHRGLEGFPVDKELVGRETATGAIPKSLKPVFRDRDDFTAGHTLTEQTLAALDASAALIVICSPAAANSRYVNEEIRLFKSLHPERPVIPLIVAGKPGNAELECFPPSLKFKLDAEGQITEEPTGLLAADIREEGDGKNLALAKVVAGLLGVSSDDVFRRAERERRRKGRVRNGVIGVLAFLAVAATGSAVYAWQQLKTNEAFLNATLKTATEIVDTAVQQAERYSIPRAATGSLLAKAEALFDNMSLLGRPTPELRRQKAWMLIQFARNYALLGNIAKWQEHAEESYRLLTDLVAEAPEDLDYQRDLSVAQTELGDVLAIEGELPAAFKLYQDALGIEQRLAQSDPSEPVIQRDLSVGYHKVGYVLQAQGKLDEAIEAYRQDLAIATRLAESDQDNAQWQRDVAVSTDNIGDMLLALGKPNEALAAYQDANKAFQTLVNMDNRNTQWPSDLLISYAKVGKALQAQGKLDDALEAYRKGFAVAQRLAQSDPSNAAWQRDKAAGDDNIGDMLLAQGKPNEALAAYQDANKVFQALVAMDASNMRWARDLAISYEKIGNTLAAQGRLEGALALYRGCLDIRTYLVASDPSNTQWQDDLAVNHGKVAMVLALQGDATGALNEFHQGRAILAALKEQTPDSATLAGDLAWLDGEIAKLKSGSAPEQGTTQPEQAARESEHPAQ